ncbi:methyl-accepting chemotaxis sensory transducer (plasmid) [Deinococcus proteolyticus MRP]|uniref:Methyl-accepting chemotaxis sensory transducer n=1 Tax=Deinococcus proteolyticus (strain ATCC 35074 / DSM 20540 / JCM 6276 / NBRC 101906 / NCIMB 13154 / VKM Ac-1939 / CCM 2703 / MRP) TaxID=693977 RepID=F0RPT6_DEIPM|nr:MULTISPECIES: methyl-accepting chemotaxis protein [Deinococcus]ADY27392.1 methyl-accepting chemotaxis sensory transducer [Deinococcus proteolyticus MRP]MCY1704267.1 methyl-accepting chemotaxis protein [Deinococcus sp. SL84]
MTISNQPLRPPEAAPTPAPGQPFASGFLDRYSVRQKLLLVSLLAGLPFAVAGGTLGVQAYTGYQRATTQAAVASNYLQLQNLQKNLRYIRGSEPRNVDRARLAQIQADTEAITASMSRTSFSDAQRLAGELSTKVQRMVDDVNSNLGTASGLTDQINSILNGELLSLFTVLAQSGDLNANARPEALGLVSLSSSTLPVTLPNSGGYLIDTLEVLERVRTAQNGVRTDVQRVEVENSIRRGREMISELRRESDLLFTNFPELASTLKPQYDAMFSDLDQSYRLMFNELVVKSKTNLTVAEALATLNPTLESQYAAFESTTKQLNRIFGEQRQAALSELLLLLLAIALLTAVIYLLTQYLIRSVLGGLSRLTEGAQALSRGQFATRVPVTTSDEFGTLATTFNAAAAQLEANERRVEAERVEQERLQNNIGQFLDVTMDIAEGDLTKRGVVTEDVLGNVVDSINLMTEELGYVLGNVQKASSSVTSGSRQMLSSTEIIQQGTAQTTQAALNVAQQTAEVNRQIQDMAQLAQATAEAARQALLASSEGQQAVQETLSGMQGIRATAQTAEERIAALSERSKQIGQIVDTISGIASQTNLLSLHASIEAAGAGEAGERFSVVADEVRQLADESAEATRQIAKLITGIQSEIAEVVRTMRDNAEQVNQGYAVAGTAGQRLEQIGELSRESARLAEQISISTREQVENIEQVSSSVQDIAQTAERSQQSVEQSRAAAEQLQQLAERLNASLTRFRLPSQ